MCLNSVFSVWSSYRQIQIPDRTVLEVLDFAEKHIKAHKTATAKHSAVLYSQTSSSSRCMTGKSRISFAVILEAELRSVSSPTTNTFFWPFDSSCSASACSKLFVRSAAVPTEYDRSLAFFKRFSFMLFSMLTASGSKSSRTMITVRMLLCCAKRASNGIRVMYRIFEAGSLIISHRRLKFLRLPSIRFM